MSISVVCTSITLALQIDYYVSCKLNCNILKKIRSVISPVRQRAGLGFPPEKFTTNRSERTNGVLQDCVKLECGAAKTD